MSRIYQIIEDKPVYLNKFHVTVDWQTYSGKARSTSDKVMAITEDEAITELSTRVNADRSCLKVNGASAIQIK